MGPLKKCHLFLVQPFVNNRVNLARKFVILFIIIVSYTILYIVRVTSFV